MNCGSRAAAVQARPQAAPVPTANVG